LPDGIIGDARGLVLFVCDPCGHMHEFTAIFVQKMVQRLVLTLCQFKLDLSSPAMGEKTEFQQVDRAQRRLSPLNPFPLDEFFLAPMAKLSLKPRGLGLRFQTGKVVIDLTAEKADL
jgi:hypothetical protein